MENLDSFRDIVDNVESLDELSTAYSLLADIMKINDMTEKINKLEEGLYSGGRAMFYFFASNLDADEVVYAAEKLKGKMNRLRKKEQRKEEDATKKDSEGEE